MSAFGSVQNKLSEISHTKLGSIGAKLLDPLQGTGIYPHDAQYEEQKKMNQRAEDLAAQQAADAAAAPNGPQAMTVREQNNENISAAADLTASGNEADAGTSLGVRRRARRVLIG